MLKQSNSSFPAPAIVSSLITSIMLKSIPDLDITISITINTIMEGEIDLDPAPELKYPVLEPQPRLKSKEDSTRAL